MKSSVHVIISGKVQGVWFRASTKQKADQLGITGWVKNTIDGDVEAVFEGEHSILKEMLEWCNHGPSLAKVKNIKVENNEKINEFDSFSIRY
jgi:acylphosphatase